MSVSTVIAAVPAYGDLLLRIGLDLGAIALLAYGLYYRRHRRRDTFVVLTLFNVGLLIALQVIAGGNISVGIGFGLFAVLFRNQDAFTSSTHMRLGPSGPLRLGPVWDLDVSAGNAAELGQLGPEGWRSADRPWGGPLMRDPGFMRALAARWRAVRRGGLAEFLQRALEQQSRSLAAPAARNFRTWNVLARPVNPIHPVRASYADEIAALQEWLARRVAWMDQALTAAEAT